MAYIWLHKIRVSGCFQVSPSPLYLTTSFSLLRSSLAILDSYPWPGASTLAFLSAWAALPRDAALPHSHASRLRHIVLSCLQRGLSCHSIQNKMMPFWSCISKQWPLAGMFHLDEFFVFLGPSVLRGRPREKRRLFCSAFSAWCSISICWMNDWMYEWTSKENLKQSRPSANVCWFEIFVEVFAFIYFL